MQNSNQTQQAGGGFVAKILELKEYRHELQLQVKSGTINAFLLDAKFRNYYKKINK